MKTIQEMLQELSQCIVTVSGEFRFRTNWKGGGGKVPQPDLDTFDPNVPFCIENVGDVPASVRYATKNKNIKISKDYKTWNDYISGIEIELNPKDRVYIKSDHVIDTEPNPRFVFNGNDARLRARGNIASLIYGTNDAYVNKYTLTEANCYNYMFSGCASLTQAPELPATTLAPDCYSYMFYGCTSLTQAPELPATTLATFCYNAMFQGCTSLTQAPELPATTLVTNCYQIMFSDCTSLTQAPELPATTLADSCYFDMFSNCTSLTQAPELPATTLADRCYYYMFSDCTSLTQAPVLPAITLTNECYRSMFYRCTKLNYVKCLATDTSATECTTNWLNNVSATGTFECDNKKYFTIDSPNGIPSGWTITEINPDVEKPDLDTFDPNVPFCIENVGNYPVEFGLYNSGVVYSGPPFIPPARTNCKISYDLKSWQDYEIVLSRIGHTTDVNKITLQNKGDRVYIKADYKAAANKIVYTTFVDTSTAAARYRARGNIVSLNMGTGDKYKTDYLEMKNDRDSYRFYQLFNGCTGLTQAPELPATTLADSCYSDMFSACWSLAQAPELPATTLTNECYHWMFQGCDSLTQAPKLPATTLAYRCYDSMFKGCRSLTQAPELPATKLADYCYYSMFEGCTKLNYVKCLATDTSATECTTNWLNNVSATGTFECDNKKYFTIDSTSGIPVGWTITEINPEVEKPDLDTFDPNVPFCIENVGDVQASVKYNTKNTNIRISKDYKTWNDYTSGDSITLDPTERVYIKSDYVEDTGINPRFIFNGDGARLRARGNIASLLYGTDDTYVNKYTSTEKHCYKYMFQNCTSLTQAPELPATTLADYCYHQMFYGCTSLTQAPELPATTLRDTCYFQMFSGCTSLTQAPELLATTLALGCCQSMFEGCTSLTQAPKLPATTLAYMCYVSMFKDCTSLTRAPELPATILHDLCYAHMFQGCTKLNYVKCLATNISAKKCTASLLEGVATTGDFYTPASTRWTTGKDGIPSGWTRHDIT